MTPSPAVSPARQLAESRRHAAHHAYSTRTTRVVVTCAACLGIQLSWLTSPLPAQTPDAFPGALIRFATAVEGSFGDAGPQVTDALDSMTRGLAEWDRGLKTLEARAAALPDTPSESSAQLRVDLAGQYMARGRSADAIRELEAAARLAPGRVDVHVLRGLAYQAADRRTEAARAFRAAWESSRTNPIAAYWLLQGSDAPVPAADLEQALDSLAGVQRAAATRVHAAAPFPAFGSGSYADSDAPLALPAAYVDAYAKMTAGDYEEALIRFRTAARSDPLLTDPAHALPSFAEGTTALRQGRPALAREHFRSVVAAMPDSSEAHRLLGLACWANRELEPSVTELTTAVRLRPGDERSRIMLARVLADTGELLKAEEVLRQTIEALPQSTYARLWLGSVYESLNRNIDAARVYEAAAPRLITGRRSLYALIAQLHEATDVDAAIDALSRSVRLNPNDPPAHNMLARHYSEQDRRDAAFAEYSAALLIDPKSPDAYMGIGQLHLNEGRFADAAIVLRHLVSLQPGYAEARYALASALLRSGSTADGNREMEAFQRVQSQRLEQSRRSMALGVIKEEATLRAAEGAFERAITLWQQAIDQEPGVASNHAALGAALTGAKRLEAAAQQYEKAAALGGPADVYRQLAMIYGELGRPTESAQATARLEQALLVPSRNEGPR